MVGILIILISLSLIGIIIGLLGYNKYIYLNRKKETNNTKIILSSYAVLTICGIILMFIIR